MRRARLAVLASLIVVVAVPATASAQVPDVPGAPPVPELPEGTVPPEVQAVIDEVVATAFAELIGFHVDGVAEAESEPGHSSAAAVDLPGVLTVGKAETDKSSSKVTVLNVGGQDVLVREGDANGGTYTGPAAPVGDVVDNVNSTLCPAGPDEDGTCVLVFHSEATSTTSGTTRSNSAEFKAVKVQVQDTEEGIEILPMNASTTAVSVFGRDRCIDVATAFIVTGSGQLAPLSLIGLGEAIKIGGFLAPC